MKKKRKTFSHFLWLFIVTHPFHLSLFPFSMYLSDFHLASANLYEHCFHFMCKLISFWIYFADVYIYKKKKSEKKLKGSLSASFLSVTRQFDAAVVPPSLWSRAPTKQVAILAALPASLFARVSCYCSVIKPLSIVSSHSPVAAEGPGEVLLAAARGAGWRLSGGNSQDRVALAEKLGAARLLIQWRRLISSGCCPLSAR